MAQEVNNQTTALQIESWIDAAVKDKKWLILELHQVDQSGLQYATTPQILSQVITYLKTSPASVITLHQGLSLMKQ
jgi:hypothetical protein